MRLSIKRPLPFRPDSSLHQTPTTIINYPNSQTPWNISTWSASQPFPLSALLSPALAQHAPPLVVMKLPSTDTQTTAHRDQPLPTTVVAAILLEVCVKIFPSITQNSNWFQYQGTGTYADPVTIATAPGELNVCEIVYLPLLTKYGRYEDDCEQCSKSKKS